LSLLQGFVNIVAQMLGAVLASVLLWVMLPHQLAKHSHLGANTLPMGSTIHGAFLGASQQDSR
jgi:glycerol uptake facilitator-like aquaporin